MFLGYSFKYTVHLFPERLPILLHVNLLNYR
jgi:hypothetical protein